MSVSKCQPGVTDTHKMLPWLRFGWVLPPGVRSVSARKLTPAEKLNDFNGCQVSGVSPLRGLGPLTLRPPSRRAVGRVGRLKENDESEKRNTFTCPCGEAWRMAVRLLDSRSARGQCPKENRS